MPLNRSATFQEISWIQEILERKKELEENETVSLDKK